MTVKSQKSDFQVLKDELANPAAPKSDTPETEESKAKAKNSDPAAGVKAAEEGGDAAEAAEEVVAKKKKRPATKHPILMEPFDKLDFTAVESLRYRAEDIARKVGKGAIKQARVRELRQELLNSERLSARFEDCPRERSVLQHAAPLSTSAPPAHLRHIPAYIKEAVGDVSDRSRKRRKLGSRLRRHGGDDPLKTLSAFLPQTKADEMNETDTLNKLENDIWESTGKKPKGLGSKAKKIIKTATAAEKIGNARKDFLKKQKSKRRGG
eukprot:CAMPEP_0196573334 /NCGR_PEP_ID=MMETSP1081-20130531/3252_1 /TAXON_ID=36882 /ORGANISM="Pyramimonas amylifera, Strain CCMP720" /LENGTH=266 /DNA_ID=CAMNT_0041890997 /DNA_START=26 /DNA_END=826 /DNA_ORIENTATION=-